MPPLLARPRHAAPRSSTRARAALVPAVLLVSTTGALGGLAAGAQADVVRATPASAQTAASQIDVAAFLAERQLVEEQSQARATRDRALAEQQAAEQARLAAEAEAARVAEEARLAAEAEAARPKFARPGAGRLTSGFGPRWGKLHAGLDLAGGVGSPIYAAADGVVESAANEGGYGQCVRIRHADGTETVYAHLSSFGVRPGEQVKAGQQIAQEGNTGHSTGPHLHFEVRVGGNPVNPLAWLRERGVDV